MSLFVEFSFLLVVAAAMAFLMRLLRQPLIIGHIMTGLLVGPFALDLLQSVETLKLFSEMGIAFLLFTVGLGLNPGILKQFGKVALITGVGQVVVTGVVGVALCLALGFSLVTSLYISIAFAFSSTIIILKLISDKGDLEKLYAKIAIGFLLIQDVIAVVLLFTIPLFSMGQGSPQKLFSTFGEVVLLTLAVFAVSKLIIVRFHSYFSRSHELLFLLATAWGIGIAVIFREVGFSFEIGALVAGIALSLVPSRHEIYARLTPLRDFFIVIFFVMLGAQMTLSDLSSVILPAIILSVMVLVGKPLILMILMGAMGYRRKTSLETGFTVAQISEFSLILIVLGVSLGHLDQSVLSLVTLVGLITIFGSTYLVLFSDKWYKFLGPYLKIFERKRLIEGTQLEKEYNIFLFGGNRIGLDFLETFVKWQKPFLVIDHDPEVIGMLAKEKIDHSFGNAGDIDFLDTLKLSNAEIIVSTIPDLEINLLILESSQKGENKPPVMVVAHSISNALRLYEAGAAYVILPHFLGGEYAASFAQKFVQSAKEVQSMRLHHIEYLKHRAEHGHEHPILEKYR